eukprot:UN25243
MDSGTKEQIFARMKEENVPEDCMGELYKELDKRMQPSPETIRGTIELKCFSKAGIEGIQYAFQEGMKCKTDKLKLVFRIIAAPKYEVSVTTLETTEGIKLINR